MGFFTNVFNQMITSIEYTKRIKKDKQALEETQQDLVNKLSDLAGKGDSLSFDYAMNVFKGVSENPILKHLFDKYSDLMGGDTDYWLHSNKFKLIFKYTVEKIPQKEVMMMANYLNSTRMMSKLQIDDGTQNAIIASLTTMARKCPLEDKLKLYSILDTSGTINVGYKTGYSSLNCDFIVSSFKGVETEKALAVLKYSDSWLSLKRDGDLVNCLIRYDERLLPAVHYSN